MIQRLLNYSLSNVHVRLLALVLASLFPAALIILHDGKERSEAVERAAREAATSLAKQLASKQRDFIWNAREFLQGLSNSREIRSIDAPGRCAAWLGSIAKLNRLYADVFVANLDGRLVCRSRPFYGIVEVSDRPYFQRAIAQRGFAVGDFQTSRITGERVIVFSYPVFDEESEIIAVVSLAVPPASFLGPFLLDLSFSSEVFAAILDTNGTLLASIPERLPFEGRPTSDFAAAPKEWFGKPSAVVETDWADGVRRLAATSPVTSDPSTLHAMIGISTGGVREQASWATQRSILILAATSAVALAVSWLVAQRFVVRRVRHLSRTAQRLGSGDLSARTQISPAAGELGGLASSLNTMAEAFQRSMTSVHERQGALRRANRSLFFLRAVHYQIGHNYNESGLAQAVCRAAVTAGGYRMACARFSASRWKRTVRSYYREGVSDLCVDEPDVSCPSGPCPFLHRGRDTVPGSAHVIEDLANAPDVEVSCRAALSSGGSTAIAFELPLCDGTAALTIVAQESDEFTQEEIGLLREAAEQLIFGVSALLARRAHVKTVQDLELRDRAIDSSRNGLLIFEYADPNQVISVNPAMLAILGAKGSWPGSGLLRDLVRERCSDADHAAFCALIDARREGRIQMTFALPGSESARLDITLALVDGSRAIGRFGVLEVRDITQETAYEQQLAYQANYDLLTGLPNRNLLADRLARARSRVKGTGAAGFVLWVDVDRFQVIHRSLGRKVADAVVIAVADRLTTEARECQTIARVSDDEFILIAEALPSQEAVGTLAARLLTALRAPMNWEGREVFPTVSIGVASCDASSACDDEALLKRAKVAVFHAKQAGGDTVRFHESEMTARAEGRMRVETALRHAIERGELSLVYQPKVDLLTGEISGCEALCRWRNDELGAIPPAEFISVAEESGLVEDIGLWVLTTACAQARNWTDRGIEFHQISVNVSPIQFSSRELVDTISQLLAHYGIAPRMLMIEITESSLMRDVDSSIENLRRLKALGVALAIDDFGTGYSSFSSLRQFPIDYLKIDRSFVANIARQADDASIAAAVVSLAHHLDLRVIAEGVETEGQMAYLRGRGCDEMQGYLFSRPVDASEFAAMVSGHAKLQFPVQIELPERTLLVVDDEPSVQSALRRTLRRQGYSVVFAANVEEALAVLSTTPVGVVISDFRMPGLDGIHFLKKAASLYPETVRIVLSGYSDVAMITDAINLGEVFRFVHKPWDDRELIEAIRQGFDRFELVRATRPT